MKKKQITISIILILGLLAVSFLFIKFFSKHEKESEIEIQSDPLIFEIKRVYMDNYAFDKTKQIDDIYLSFAGIDESVKMDAVNQIDLILNQKIDFSVIENLPQNEFNKKFKIYFVKNISGEFKTFEISDMNENDLIEKISNDLPFKNKKVDLSYSLQSYNESDDNQIIKDLSLYFHALIDGFKVINLGWKVDGYVNKNDDTESIVVNQNLDHEIDLESSNIEINTIDFSDFIETIINKYGLVFKIEQVSDKYLGFEIFDLSSPQMLTLYIKNVKISYMYLKEKGVIIPVFEIGAELNKKEIVFYSLAF